METQALHRQIHDALKVFIDEMWVHVGGVLTVI